MKKWSIGLILVALVFTFSFSVYAKPGKFNDEKIGKFHNGPHQQIREDARYIIHRSAMVLFAARRAAERGHRYFGLARAFAHQQKARELYEDGSYREAIFHSLRARDLAFQIIRENREKPGREFFRDDLEDRYTREAPRDNELDLRINLHNIGSDDEAVRFNFDIDIHN
jgi:hypothetical protein